MGSINALKFDFHAERVKNGYGEGEGEGEGYGFTNGEGYGYGVSNYYYIDSADGLGDGSGN